jgi:hypothetical protein
MPKETTMCLRSRDFESLQRRAAQEPLPPFDSGPPVSRPRLAGAIAAAILALVVVAAMVFPSATTAVAKVEPAAVAPVVIEQTSAGVDDGVPSGSDVARNTAGAGHCQHDL